jgi:hypothetical protein
MRLFQGFLLNSLAVTSKPTHLKSKSTIRMTSPALRKRSKMMRKETVSDMSAIVDA